MMTSTYLIKLGSRTLLESEAIFDELAALAKTGARILLVAGGAHAISRIYAQENRPMPFLTLAGGDTARYCNPAEMPFILRAYKEIVIPRIASALRLRGVSTFSALAGENGLVTGTRTLPLKALLDGKKVVVRDSQVGIFENCRKEIIADIFRTNQVVCLTPPLKDTESEAYLNIDADMLAANLAVFLNIAHVRFVTGTPGVLSNLDNPSSTIGEVRVGDELPGVHGRMKQKLKGSRFVAEKGIADVCITGPHSFSSEAATTWFFDRYLEPPAWDLFYKLVSIPSISGDERVVSSYLLKCYAAEGVEKGVDAAGNLVLKKGNGPLKLLLLGHMDTVPFLWKPQADNGLVSGRGAVDAKASFACFLEVLKRVKVPPFASVYVMGAVEEEISSSKGSDYIRESFSADAVIIGEPSGADSLTIGYNGMLKLEITVEYEASHTAGKENRFVIEKLYGVAENLRLQLKGIHEKCLCGLIEVANRHRLERETASGTLIARIPPVCGKNYLDKLNLDFGDPGVKIEILRATPGYQTGRSSRLVAAFSRAFAANNLPLRHVFKNGTSDMNTLAATWDVPMVAFGPGNSALDHTPREMVARSEFELACNLLESAIREFFKLAGQP